MVVAAPGVSVPLSLDVAPAAPNPRSAPVELAGRSVYLIGIGGSGMSGLARLLRHRGALVRGSDASAQETTAALAGEGVTIDTDQTRAWLPEICDLVVATAAIKPEHPQLLAARERGIRVLTYAQALGLCMSGRTGVSIAGTHGKSTTTAMLGCVLADAGIDPTVIVGATCAQLGGGFRLGAAATPAGPYAGRPGLLIAESCEFDRSFHNYFPVLAAITAVEADHLDIYGTLDAVVEAFAVFARQVAPAEEGGRLLIAHEGAHRREVTAGVKAKVETIGFSPAADWSVRYDAATRRTELIHPKGQVCCAWTMLIPGEHNAMNAATAAALAIMLGADPASVARTLSGFRGVDRRMQVVGTRPLPGGGGVKIYDDYGHHPTEVEATLRALRQFERPEARGGRLICVFQPHQHSRTRHLLDEFASAFSAADMVIVPHIYFVRDSEQEKQLVSAADLVDRLRGRGVLARHVYPFEAIVEDLGQITRDGDVVVVMGAGPVWQVARGFLAAQPR
jgi:UDP-N-acetylmuramate--alanine ligase